MNSYEEARKLREKVAELQRTIQFLCNTMGQAADKVRSDPAMARLMLRDAVNDQRFEFR